ncbi:MAG: hypothetical protein ACK53L_33300, partial [Pirellulaceae bacterium]
MLHWIGEGDLTVNGSGSHAIHNAGSLIRSGDGTTTVGIAFNNSGSLEVQQGTLQVSVGGASTSGIVIGAGALFDLAGGTLSMTNASNVSGQGLFRIAGGTLDLPVNESLSMNNLSFTSGQISGGGTLTLSGDSVWTSGAMTSPTGKLVIASGGTLQITGTSTKLLSRILESAGTITYDGSGLFFGVSNNEPGTINNLSGGVLHWIGEGDLTVNGSGSHAIHNAGSLIRSGDGTTTVGVALNSSGSVVVQQGTLQIGGVFNSSGSLSIPQGSTLNAAGGGTVSGTVTVSSGGVLRSSGGILTLASSFQSDGDVQVAGGGILIGEGVSVTMNNLSFTSGQISGGGTLTLSGDSVWTSGAMTSPTG